MAKHGLAAIGVGVLVGCSGSDTADTTPETAESYDISAEEAVDMILPGSVGGVRAGGTLGNFRSVMGDQDLVYDPNFMVDLSALCLQEDQTDALCALTWYSEVEDQAAPVELLQTLSTRFRTPEGIGPGSTLAQAEAVYGQATLSYSVENESREYVTFENGPDGIGFRPAVEVDGENVPFAGVYENEDTIAPITQSYKDGAYIEIVEVFQPLSAVTGKD